MIIKPKLMVEIEPNVRDICAVISAALIYYPGQEKEFLQAIRDSADKRIEELEKK
ncbi:hypothetical protein V3851_09620 [Paenibacillus sp. M1]|uniref:Uncharacterized protein n=1 Tax=Paenibacillus haidiansis TaxID=1574488 RepID=A0ABU7VRT6_9BACL